MVTSTIISVFAKPPVPGKTKSRLAARIGDVRAAQLARAFLSDTWDVISGLTWARPVLATTDGSACDFDLPGNPEIWLQGEGDLGAKLERILQRGLGEADLVIAIGADTPGLFERVFLDARDALMTADAVLGPSDDGGFYLIGLSRCPTGLFDRLPWSDPTTFAATRARLSERHLAPRILEPWFDVDEAKDLDRLRGEIERGVVHAPATRRVLTGFLHGAIACE